MDGRAVVERVFQRVKDERVRGFVVYLPMVDGDSAEAARDFEDPRVRCWWDGEREVGLAFAPVLALPRRVAWDVYMVFPPGVTWGEKPPVPTFWMHQLSGVDRSNWLDAEAFEKAVEEAL